jgi:hypothetical protein
MTDTTHEAPDNLVKWLRIHASQIGIAGFGAAAGVAEQAADRIEELEAKLAAERERCAKVVESLWAFRTCAEVAAAIRKGGE